MVGYETTQSHLVKLFGKENLVYRWGCVLRLHGQQLGNIFSPNISILFNNLELKHLGYLGCTCFNQTHSFLYLLSNRNFYVAAML